MSLSAERFNERIEELRQIIAEKESDIERLQSIIDAKEAAEGARAMAKLSHAAIRGTPAARTRARKAGQANGIDPLLVEVIQKLRTEGATLAEIAGRFGLSPSGVSRICNRKRRD